MLLALYYRGFFIFKENEDEQQFYRRRIGRDGASWLFWPEEEVNEVKSCIYTIETANQVVYLAQSFNLSATMRMHTLAAKQARDPLHLYLHDKEWWISELERVQVDENRNDMDFLLYCFLRNNNPLFNMRFGDIKERQRLEVIRELALLDVEYDYDKFLTNRDKQVAFINNCLKYAKQKQKPHKVWMKKD